MGEFSQSEKMRNVAEVRGNAEGPFELCGYKCIVRIVNVVVCSLPAMFSYSGREEQ